MDEDLLDSALNEFETPEEPKPDISSLPKPETIQDIMEEIKNEIKDEPENSEEMENLINSIASEFENNSELKEQIEQIGKDFFQEGVLKDSMVELRDKLKQYLDTHTNLPLADLSRYQSQLQLYNQLVQKITNGQEDEAMELVGKLSYYGELPSELLPPMPEECSII